MLIAARRERCDAAERDPAAEVERENIGVTPGKGSKKKVHFEDMFWMHNEFHFVLPFSLSPRLGWIPGLSCLYPFWGRGKGSLGCGRVDISIPAGDWDGVADSIGFSALDI